MDINADVPPERTIRITVIGDGYTGKTCMLIVYKDKRYSELYTATVFDSYSMNIPIDGVLYKMILADTAGQEDYDRLRPLAYKETDVFVICFAVDKLDSFENVKLKWSEEVKHFKPNSKIILVATKVDLRTAVDKNDKKIPCVDTEQGEKLKKSIGAHSYIECSSKQCYNISRVFEAALQSALKKPTVKRKKDCFFL